MHCKPNNKFRFSSINSNHMFIHIHIPMPKTGKKYFSFFIVSMIRYFLLNRLSHILSTTIGHFLYELKNFMFPLNCSIVQKFEVKKKVQLELNHSHFDLIKKWLLSDVKALKSWWNVLAMLRFIERL